MADLATMLRSGALGPSQVPPELLMGTPQRRAALPFPVPPLPPQPRPETSGIALQPQSQGERDELAQDASSAGQAALTAGMSAIPLGALLRGGQAAMNLIPRGVAAAQNAAPGAVPAAAAVTAATAGSQAAGPEQQDGRVLKIQDLKKEIARNTAMLEKHATTNFQSKTARENAAAPYLQAISAAQNQITALEQELGSEERARANSSFDKAWPAVNAAWPAIQWGGPVAAAMLTKAGGNIAERMLNRPWHRAVQQGDQALASGNAAGAMRNSTRADAFLAEEPTSRLGQMLRRGGDFARETAVPTTAGAAVGMEAALFPYQYNLRNAQPGSPERQEAERRLSIENFPRTAASGLAPGILGGFTGAHLPNVTAGRRPIAETRALAQSLSGGPRATPLPPSSPGGAPPSGPPQLPSPGPSGPQGPTSPGAAPAAIEAEARLQLPAPEASPNPQTLADFLRSSSANSNVTPRRAPGVMQHPNDPPNVWRNARPGQRGRFASPPKKPPTDETLD